jgi:hypothetical protein
MKELQLPARRLTADIARELEELKLISFIHHPDRKQRAELKADFMKGENFPATTHGFHSVTITYTDIFLSAHPPGQDEIVFLWEHEEQVKPLYFVFAGRKREQYLRALEQGKLVSGDFFALRMPFNDPRWSSFIVWDGTVHCELTDTVSPGSIPPSFYVLEPLELKVQYTEEQKHGLRLKLAP